MCQWEEGPFATAALLADPSSPSAPPTVPGAAPKDLSSNVPSPMKTVQFFSQQFSLNMYLSSSPEKKKKPQKVENIKPYVFHSKKDSIL